MHYMKSLAVASVAVLSLGLQGCVIAVNGDGEEYTTSSYESQEENNREAIASFTDGIELAAVQKEMGTPNFSDLVTVDGVRYRVLYYRTHRKHADGNTTRDECTPLVFADGVLIGTGELALERIPQNN
ncbi:DUF3192 domain-containing protein [Pseudidiomarina donghaiensis]|nr:DUF3192 domain-containing protein [Pseudidiomarina donghaiensis]SFV23043.1 Protein of unknown function [Pseudidiomarina donghaiensis]